MATQTIRPEPPLVVIVGPTASGKTGLAVDIARNFNGEIISADSRAVYRHLSIGTAKPSKEEQAGIPHWGIDLVDPGERFTVADFQTYAKAKINEIRSRGKVPLLVGGTGLYVDAVIYDFRFPQVKDSTIRRDALLEKHLDELHEYCIQNNIPLPENTKNKRHVVNAILRKGLIYKRKHNLEDNIIVVGITTEKNILHERIVERSRTIFDQDIIGEAKQAAEMFGWDSEAMTGNIYPLIRDYLAGSLSRELLVERFIISDRHLAKRQMTWFRRDAHIQWYSLADARKYLAQKLSGLSKS